MAYRSGLAQKAIFSHRLKERELTFPARTTVSLSNFSHTLFWSRHEVGEPPAARRAGRGGGGRGEGCRPRRDRRGSQFDVRHRRVNSFYERVHTPGCEAVNGKGTSGGGGRGGSLAPPPLHSTPPPTSTRLKVPLAHDAQRTSAVGWRQPPTHNFIDNEAWR